MTPEVLGYPGASWCASPNFGERVGVSGPDMLVLHYTGMESGESAQSWLCNPESQVSSHYIVHESGDVIQMVDERKRAWHAGKSSWRGETDINSLSIGVEIVNAGPLADFPEYPAQQVASVIDLCQNCAQRWAIAPQRIVAHSDIAPQRKEDPGEKFPWRSLFQNGVGHWIEPSAIASGRYFQRGDQGQPVEALQAMLSLYGYAIDISGIYDENTQSVVTAFQRHFRPEKVDGVADFSTIDTLHRLLSALPESPPQS